MRARMPTDTAPLHPAPAPTAMRPGAVRFGPFVLLLSEQRLLRDGADVPTGSRALAVLALLAGRPGRLVTKDELLAGAWPGLVVEESNLQVQVSQLRKSLGADAIATVPGLGYRFTRPVLPVADDEAGALLAPGGAAARAPDAGAATGASTAGPPRLTVLVLPFVEAGAGADDAYVADAVTDDVIAQVSKIRGCTVIASGTSLAFKGEAFDWAETARGLGVRYVLQGRIARDGTGVEVLARLSDAATRAVVWSDRFEVDASSLRQIRRELVARLAIALDLQLTYAEAHRLAAQPAAGARADDLVMRGRTVGGANWGREHYERALAFYDEALRLEPGHAEALARRALGRALIAFAWPGPSIAEDVARAEADALRALELDSLDPVAHRALATVRQQQFRLDEALRAVEVALALDPNDPLSLSLKGEIHKYRAEDAPARAALHRAIELSPRDPHRWTFLNRIGTVALLAGDSPQAVHWLEQSFAVHRYWGTAMSLVAAWANLGHTHRVPELLQLRDADLEAIRTYRQWNRASNHPAYLRRFRTQVFEPLLRCGVYDDPSAIDAWEARQLRAGAE